MPPPTKRRKIGPTVVEEISFDLAARQEYLTGFHKRKLQRAKAAQETAGRRARAEKLEDRKQLREHRKAELARHVEEVNAMLRPIAAVEDAEGDEAEDGPDEEWNGISEPTPPPIDHEAEYIDEEKYTTVTVEAMDVSKAGLFKAQQEKDEQNLDRIEEAATAPDDIVTENKKRPWMKTKPKDKDGLVQKRKKKRNFRYESKVDRKEARSRQKTKNSKQARDRRAAG